MIIIINTCLAVRIPISKCIFPINNNRNLQIEWNIRTLYRSRSTKQPSRLTLSQSIIKVMLKSTTTLMSTNTKKKIRAKSKMMKMEAHKMFKSLNVSTSLIRNPVEV
jgi:hypothetical protein